MSKKFQIISLVIVAVIAFVAYIVVGAINGNGQSTDDQSQQTQQQ